jgi:MFS transporter, DHA2 family, multidrug resistance protein
LPDANSTPAKQAAAPHRAWVVATVMTGSLSTMAAATIINVAFPALLREFHVGHDSLQWIATGFLAATTTTMLATAWLVESFGPRKTFTLTLVVFLAASLLGAASWSTDALIAARILQGAAAGIMQPLCMIALFEVFPPHRRGAAMGMFGINVVLVPAIGPSIGGLLVEAFGWRSIFLMPVPFCVVAMALATRYLSGRKGHGRRLPFDWAGSALLAAALVALLNVPVIGHRNGWASAALVATVALSAALALAFVAWEFRARVPLLALKLFAVRGFRSAALVSFAYGLGLFGTTYLIPVFVQDIAGYTPTQAGYLLLWPGLALGVTIMLAGRLTDRVDPRWIVALGLGCFALSSLLLVFTDARTSFVVLALWLIVGRVGLGMIIPALNVGAVQTLAAEHIAYAASTVNFVRQLGGALGVNLLAVLLEWRLGAYAPEGRSIAAFQECFWVVTIAFAAAIIPAVAISQHTPKPATQRS